MWKINFTNSTMLTILLLNEAFSSSSYKFYDKNYFSKHSILKIFIYILIENK